VENKIGGRKCALSSSKVGATLNEESYFTLDGNEWQQQSYYVSENHPTTEDVKFICKTKFPAKVL
jgi:hypothetical protein